MKTNLATQKAAEEVVTTRHQEEVLDAATVEYIKRSLESGGEQEILVGESRDEAAARLMRHYGWDAWTAHQALLLAEGWSDVVPLDDEGNPLPYFRVRDEDETAVNLVQPVSASGGR